MSYIDIINLFIRTAPYQGGFTSSCTALFMAIMDRINANEWRENTKVDRDRMLTLSGISKNTYDKTKAWLSENGWIEYTSGRNGNIMCTFSLGKNFHRNGSEIAISQSHSQSQIWDSDWDSDWDCAGTINKRHIDLKDINVNDENFVTKSVENTPHKKSTEKFKKPTVEEISEYFLEKTGVSRKIADEFATDFHSYYESVGWKVGKNRKPMSSWKGALSGTWKETVKKFIEKDKLIPKLINVKPRR